MTISGPVITAGAPVGRRAAAGLIMAALCTLCGAGCAESAVPAAPPTPTAPTTVTTAAALCAAAADFRTAANQLAELDATAVGLNGVKAALQNLGVAGSELADAAAAEFDPQVDELNQAIAALGNTIAGLDNQADLSSKLGAIATSVSGVEQAAAPIMDSAQAGCPSLPASSAPPAAPPNSGPPTS
jgi:hypothetical protein